MYFSAAASSENDQGSMNLASKTAPVASTRPSSVAAIQRSAGCQILALDIREDLAAVGLEPAPVQVFGRKPKLNDEIAGQILRLDLAAFLLP